MIDTEPFAIEDLTVIPFKQQHGKTQSLGFRFGDFAYSTDVNNLDETAFDVLKGIKYGLWDLRIKKKLMAAMRRWRPS